MTTINYESIAQMPSVTKYLKGFSSKESKQKTLDMILRIIKECLEADTIYFTVNNVKNESSSEPRYANRNFYYISRDHYGDMTNALKLLGIIKPSLIQHDWTVCLNRDDKAIEKTSVEYIQDALFQLGYKGRFLITIDNNSNASSFKAGIVDKTKQTLNEINYKNCMMNNNEVELL